MATKTTRIDNAKKLSKAAAATPPGVWMPAALALWNVRHSPDFANYRAS